MGTTAQKLEYLGTTKSQLKDMINYGLPTENQITNETTFREYVSSIFEAFLESLRDSSTLYTNLPKISGNGTQITLNDTANAPMRITLKASELLQDATPTPDNPQDIHTISGNNTIVVEGKNLFPLDTTQFPLTSSGGALTATLNEDGSIHITGTKTTTTWENIQLPRINNVRLIFREGITYTSAFTMGMIKKTDSSWVGNKTGTFTPSEDWIATNSYWTTNTTGTIDRTIYPMIMIGTGTIDSSTFAPYQGTQTTSIDLNTFKASEVRQGAYDNPANMQRVCWFGKLISSGDIVNVTCNRNDINYALGRATQDKNVANTSISQDTGWQTGSYTFTSTGNGYFFIGVKKTNNGSINPSEITDNDFKVSYGNEGTTLEYCDIGNYSDDFLLTSGKNLFDISVGFTNAYINSSGSILNANTNALFNGYIEVEPNTSYTMSCNKSVNNLGISEFNSSQTFIKRTQANSTTLNTITTDSNTKYLRLQFNYDNSTTITQTIIDGLEIMLNKGTTALPYEPYGTNQWYLKKNIGKVVLDGSVSGAIGTNSKGIKYFYKSIADKINGGAILSNNFSQVSSLWTLDTYTDCMTAEGSNKIVAIMTSDSTITTLEQFKTWFSTHNTEIWYQLATPTYTQITGTLETQLTNIREKMLSYKGTTNVSQINNDLPFVLGVSAIEDLE